MNPEAQYGYVQPQKSSSPRKKILLIIIIIAALSLGALLFSFNSPHKDGEATTFISLVEKNDAAGSYKFFSTSQKSAVDLATWTSNLKQITNTLGGQKLKLDHTSTSATNPNTKYEYYTFTSNSKQYTYSLVLASSKGKWLVESSTLTQDAGYSSKGKASIKE